MKKVIIFSAPWCGSCGPIKEWASRNIMGKPGIQYQVVDISSQPDFASKFGINGLPTLLVLDAQDKELHRQTGYINKMLVCNTLGISN